MVLWMALDGIHVDDVTETQDGWSEIQPFKANRRTTRLVLFETVQKRISRHYRLAIVSDFNGNL